MEPISKGRKPLSTKKANAPLREADLFGNALVLDPELVAELEAKNLSWRFIDIKRLTEMGGYHPKGWTIYKRASGATLGQGDFRLGQDPDGIVRRGTVVLAVKPKELADRHRQFLREKAERYTTLSHTQAKVDELRQMAKSANMDKMIVHEGYEEN